MTPTQPIRLPPIRSAVLWAPPLLALALLALLVASGQNPAWFQILNALGTRADAATWSSITMLGDTLVALAILLPVYQRRPDLVWSLLLAAIVATIVVQGLKFGLDLPRPPGTLAANTFHLIGPGYRHHSFPSGHTTTVFTLLGAWLLLLRPKNRWLILGATLWALLAAVSRSAIGVHWPQDLLAGIAVGWCCAALGILLAGRWPWGLRRSARSWIHGLLLAATLTLLLYHEPGYPLARPVQQAIAVGCLLMTAWLMSRNGDQDADPND